jgi:hypothetical protein
MVYLEHFQYLHHLLLHLYLLFLHQQMMLKLLLLHHLFLRDLDYL